MSDPFENLLEQLPVNDLVEQRQRYLEEAEELRARAETIDRLIAIKQRRAVPPGQAFVPPATVGQPTVISGRPGVADAILIIMNRDDPEGIWNADRLLPALEAHGWAPQGKTPRNSIAATLSRLRSVGEIERVGSGDYQLAAHKRQGSVPAASRNGVEQLRVEEGG